MCVCVMAWMITCWTRDRQPLPSPKKVRGHRDGFMVKAETSHTTHTHPLARLGSSEFDPGSRQLLGERGSALSLTLT